MEGTLKDGDARPFLGHEEEDGIIADTPGAESQNRPPALLDVDAVAKLLTCSPRTVWRLSDAGKMPAPVRVGRLVRWPLKVLMEWIDRGCPVMRPVRGAGLRRC
jgi:excisionase family DNA binding protein